MKHIFGRQNIRELVNYSSFLCDGSTINVFLWNVLRAKMKVYTFFISSSIFHLSLRLLRQDVNFRLNVTKKLLTRFQVNLSCWGVAQNVVSNLQIRDTV